MPNPTSLMTGRMPSLHGLRYNGCVQPKRANTIVDALAKSGYRTAAIRKCHLQSFTGLAPFRAEDACERLITEACNPYDVDYGREGPDRYGFEGTYGLAVPYFGYQHIDLVTGHGDQCGGRYG